jgi:hypothetical protein
MNMRIFSTMLKESANFFKWWITITIISVIAWIVNFIPFLGWMTTERMIAISMAAFIMFPVRGALYGFMFWAIQFLMTQNQSWASKVKPFLVVNKLEPKKNKDDPEQKLDRAVLGIGNLAIILVCLILAISCFVFSKATSTFITMSIENIVHWIDTLLNGGIFGGLASLIILIINIGMLVVIFGSLSWVVTNEDSTTGEGFFDFVKFRKKHFGIIALILISVKCINTIYFAYNWANLLWGLLFTLIGSIFYFVIIAIALYVLRFIAQQEETADGDDNPDSDGWET